ncbi:DUF6864 domain-containing function [Aeromonas sp. Y318-1]|uniref:DUF6864 domain-containing function n=1 Tax=Aeromonas TaxID=642 RepID=UPI0022E4626B|nr:hypothetical protein [Aeromonas sp. Y318-1]
MKITTGNLEVIESGLVRNGLSNNIKFDFQDLWVDFQFIKDNSGPRSNYVPSDDLKGLKVEIYNNDSPTGAGVFQPIKIGVLEGRELWLAYFASKPFDNHNSWTLEYVFYKGAGVDE